MSYIGHVAEIPVGYGGLTGSRNQAQVRPDQLLSANNVSYDSGNLRKEGGAQKYNATAITGAPNVIGGFDWFPSDGQQRMVVFTSDGAILRDAGSGTFPDTLKSGLLTTSVMPFFVEGGAEQAGNDRKLFIFTGRNPVQVLTDGATTTDLATPPADWSGLHQPSVGFIHENRLWAGGNGSDPHRLYYSLATNHEDFTTTGTGSISIYPGEGERIIAAASFKGLAVVFKYPRGIYLLDTSDPTPANWRASPMTRAVGTVSPLAIVAIDDDMIFLDGSGNFQLLSAVTEFGDMSNRNLSEQAQLNSFMRANVNFSQFRQVQSVYYSHKREAHFILPGLSSLTCNRRLVLDFNAQQPRFRFSDRDTNHAIWLRKGSDEIQRPMIGESGGFVYYLDTDEKTKDGAAYMASLQTAHMDLSWVDPSLATKNKISQFLELVVEPTGNWNLTVDVLWDDRVTDTVQFNMGTSGEQIGSFVIGTDQISGDALLNQRKKIVGTGHRLSLVVRNAGVGEDFSVSKFYLYFKVSDERLKD